MTEGPGRARAPVFEVRGVRHAFGGHVALESVDLEVLAGERVALLGPSGAGKSTLLRLISGAIEPTQGEVHVFGEPLAGPEGRRGRSAQRRVASLTQDLALIDQVRVLHNVNAGRLGAWSVQRALRTLVSTRADPVVSTALEEVGLGWATHARTEQLSGGERQRVALARLLVQDADAVVADEPVSSLDPTTSHRVLGLLCASAATGTAVVSIHQPELARDHFTRMVGLRDGRVVLDVPAEDLSVHQLDELYARA